MQVMIKLKLKPATGILIGGYAPPPGLGIDKGTAKRLDGCLIIPGSTVKGRLRNECERIARTLGADVCPSPKPDRMCPHYFLNKANEPKADYCIICQSFGSPWKPGALHFSDLVWNPPEDWDTAAWRQIRKTQVRPGVSILRSRWIKVEEKLFFMETSLPGVESVFEGTISGNVESKQHLALLTAGLKSLFMVGGTKSRGLGWLLTARGEPIFELVQTGEEALTEAELMEELRLWNSSQSPL